MKSRETKFWRARKVLITGVNGFIGAWLASRLLGCGANVTALTRGNITNPILQAAHRKLAKVIKSDITSHKLLSRIFKAEKIDTCFHLAAQPLVNEAFRLPLSTFELNIRGTWNILEAARAAGVKRLVIASADKVYGSQEKLPYKEDSPLLAVRPYDASKACGDILSRTYAHTFNLPVVVARCSNVYGGGDLNFTRIIPDTIKAVLNNNKPVIQSNGLVFRDYIYISDVVEAYLILAKALDKEEIRGEAFNFGSGKPTSVLEVVRKIIAICDKPKLKPVILRKTNSKNEIDRQFLSIEKAKKILGWSPSYNMDDGLKLTIDWYKDFFEGFRA